MTRTLAQWLSLQESQHPKSWDLGLERIATVWQMMGAPALARHVITIAGTNGKGSCVRWLEALCVAHGYRVSSFSSPHLQQYNERIREQGEPVRDADLVEAFTAIEQARGEITLTYFEWSALAAFYLMAKRFPDVAVLEVGLGGRLDATNIIDADSVIFTRIGLDHQDWLGHDVETIAREKAGVLRAGQNVYFADAHPPSSLQEAVANAQVKALYRATDSIHVSTHVSTYRATQERSAMCCPDREGLTPLPSNMILPEGRGFNQQGIFDEHGASLQLHLPEPITLPLPVSMPGQHQYGQLAACALALQHAGFTLNESALQQAVREIRHLGRLTVLATQPLVLVDVAHNADSAEVLAQHIHERRASGSIQRHVHVVCGMLNDKEHQAVLAHLAPEVQHWYLASLDGVRGTEASVLQQSALRAGIAAEALSTYADVANALHAAKNALQPDDTLVVMGSFVTVALALPILTSWFMVDTHAE